VGQPERRWVATTALLLVSGLALLGLGWLQHDRQLATIGLAVVLASVLFSFLPALAVAALYVLQRVFRRGRGPEDS